MKPRVGYIPERITYVTKPIREIATNWSDSWAQGTPLNKVAVSPSFPVPADKENLMETARRWGRSGGWNNGIQAKVPFTETTEDNDPKRLIICAIEHRSEGGRAYKVMDEQKRYFDFREDVLLETLLNAGCETGGELSGSYIWARVGSQMKLIRVDSVLHRQMILSTGRKTLKNIPVKDLEVGRVYSQKAGQKLVFIGFCRVQGKKHQVWFSLYGYDKTESPYDEFAEDWKRGQWTRLDIKKSCAVIEAHEMTQGFKTADECVKRWQPIMALAAENLKDKWEADSKTNKYRYHYTTRTLKEDLEYFAAWGRAHPMDTKPPMVKVFEENGFN